MKKNENKRLNVQLVRASCLRGQSGDSKTSCSYTLTSCEYNDMNISTIEQVFVNRRAKCAHELEVSFQLSKENTLTDCMNNKRVVLNVLNDWN